MGRSNAKAAEAARKTQMNFMNPAMNKEGVDRMIMESLQVREPGANAALSRPPGAHGALCR